MFKELIRDEIFEHLKLFINENGKDSFSELESQINFSIDRPKEAKFGDFSTNVALTTGKLLGQAPRALAQALSAKLNQSKLFSKVEIAGPGFINFFLNNATLVKIISHIGQQQKVYGKSVLSPQPKALVEFVSANPTGPLHLGHARGAFAGDALARMLEAAGFLVTREFYVNDAGNQVEILGRTIHKRYRELFGEKIVIEPGEYPGENVIEIAQALKEQDGDKWLGLEEKHWLEPLVRFGVNYNLSIIKKTLVSIDISMDSWFLENTLHQGSALPDLIAEYEKLSMIYEADQALGSEDKIRRDESKAAKYAHLQAGGWFLKTSLFGDEEDRIIKRRDGRFVYLTADLAYHHHKFLRNFDLIVDVFGGDHAGHIGRIKAGMQALEHDVSKLKFAVVQMVRLLKNGQEVRFSKRSGQVVGIEDLVDEVGKDVARFIFLMRSLNSQFDIDFDQLTKQSQDNPVFYVQYGHARMATLLNKAKEKGISFDIANFDEKLISHLSLAEEKELLLKISELPDLVSDAAKALEPHRLIYFAQDLVKLFHSYFTKYRSSEKIISDDLEKTMAKLSLVFVVKQTIFNALQILGISAPDYMDLAHAPSDDD